MSTNHFMEYSAVLFTSIPICTWNVGFTQNATSVGRTSNSTSCANVSVVSDWCFQLYRCTGLCNFYLWFVLSTQSDSGVIGTDIQGVWNSCLLSSRSPLTWFDSGHFLLKGPPANPLQFFCVNWFCRPFTGLLQMVAGVFHAVVDLWKVGVWCHLRDFRASVWRVGLMVSCLGLGHPLQIGRSSVNDLSANLGRNKGTYWRFLHL